MTKRRQRRTAVERASIIERWRTSGLTAQRFASAEGIPASSLYLWRKQLGAGNEQQTSSRDTRPPSAFSEIRLTTQAAQQPTRIEVVTRNGRVVRVDGNISAHALRNVLAVVEQC